MVTVTHPLFTLRLKLEKLVSCHEQSRGAEMFDQFGEKAHQAKPGTARRPSYDLWGEPPIEEVLGDDAIRKVMARDGVSENHLRALLTRVRFRLL